MCSINLTKAGSRNFFLEIVARRKKKKKGKELFDRTYISFANSVADRRLIRFTLQIAIPGKIFFGYWYDSPGFSWNFEVANYQKYIFIVENRIGRSKRVGRKRSRVTNNLQEYISVYRNNRN